MAEHTFKVGISTLLSTHKDWLKGKRVGLLAHSASRDERGISSLQRLQQEHIHVTALFSPEHGFDSTAGAGEKVNHSTEAHTGLPIYSLYGDSRKPAPDSFAQLDVIICDLQDLATRCYTYVSTLRYVLETATETNTEVIVADRPVPLPSTLDGPMLDPAQSSFVGMVPTPLCYAMTPGETALFLKEQFNLELHLQVAHMEGYNRECSWPATMPWIRPSPGIQTWRTAAVYPATVCCEALPALHYGQSTNRIFQCMGANGLDAAALCGVLAAKTIPGTMFTPREQTVNDTLMHYVDIHVQDAAHFRPLSTSIHILTAIRDMYSNQKIWGSTGTREAFFDHLMGSCQVRQDLQSGLSAQTIIDAWQPDITAFRQRRTKCLLYHPRS